MSYVTTVTIISNDWGDNFRESVKNINEYFTKEEKLGVPFAPIKDDGAGTKSPQREFLIGGINYLNHDEFIEFFKSLKMRDTLLILAPDGGEYYTIIPSDTNVEIE